MVSFDIVSLFTNVPLMETIAIIINKIFADPHATFLGLSKALFTRLLEVATINSFFMFDNKLYKQSEGLGMGLPQSPIFTDIFISDHEERWLANCHPQFKPVFFSLIALTHLNFCNT